MSLYFHPPAPRVVAHHIQGVGQHRTGHASRWPRRGWSSLGARSAVRSAPQEGCARCFWVILRIVSQTNKQPTDRPTNQPSKQASKHAYFLEFNQGICTCLPLLRVLRARPAVTEILADFRRTAWRDVRASRPSAAKRFKTPKKHPVLIVYPCFGSWQEKRPKSVCILETPGPATLATDGTLATQTSRGSWHRYERSVRTLLVTRLPGRPKKCQYTRCVLPQVGRLWTTREDSG